MESNITISNSEFTFNQATGCDNDSVLEGLDGTGSVNINNSTFQNNTSDQDGGIAVVSPVFQFHRAMLTATQLPDMEERWLQLSFCIVLSGSTLDHNIAHDDGGVVYADHDSTVTVN